MPIQIPIHSDAMKVFCRAHGVRELAPFGSALREDFRPEGDVDVLIDLAPGSRIGLVALQRMRDELTEIFGRPVDFPTRSGLNRHIRRSILEEAKVIHAE